MTAGTFVLHQGRGPLLVSAPHCGTVIPEDVLSRMAPVARQLDDTDWYIDLLYDFVPPLGASFLVATHSRYVIDLNRPPDNADLYPGQDTTGLCPLDTFDREPLYLAGNEPDEAEIVLRLKTYWHPYHDALNQEIARIRGAYGFVLLWDAHSIRSRVPRFFRGCLPDFSIGTADGVSCGSGLGPAMHKLASSWQGHTCVLNGRFKGGYITRHYGRPKEQIHAVQLELAKVTYMEEVRPYRFDEGKAGALRTLLLALIHEALAGIAVTR
jgi:N-formylglutamate deformylase